MSAGFKTTWRYCVSRERVEGGSLRYSIREVYTDADGSLSWSTDPMMPQGETWREVADDLSLMARGIGGQVLDLTLDPPALVTPIGVEQ